MSAISVGRLGIPVALCIGLLVLSACGSGRSAATAGHSTPAARATSSPPASGSPVSVRVGPYTQVFATPLPADAAQGSVIEGFRKAQILWEKSQNVGHLVPPVTDYVTGRALSHLLAAMAAFKARHLVPAGTDRFFNTRVTGITDRRATVATCDDGSKYKQENSRTGRVDTALTPQANQKYLFETWRMVRLAGHWAITDFTLAMLPNPRAEPCQP